METLKSILNWHSSGSPSKLFFNGQLFTKSQEIADTQNSYFIDKVKKLREENSLSVSDPLSNIKAQMTGRTCSMSLSCVQPEEVRDIISNLSNSAAFDLDEIETYVLKLLKDEWTPEITHTINLSIRHGVFPNKWKDSKAIPIYKKDDILRPKNYHPI